MSTHRRLARLLTLLALLAALAQGAPARAAAAQPATIYVCKNGCQFATVGAALAAAAPGDTVWVGPGTYTEGLVLTKNVTIQGAGAASVTLSGGGKVRVVDVPAGVDATLAGVTIRGGSAGSGGGGIDNRGTLAVVESTVTENMTGIYRDGAGIQNAGSLSLIRSAVVSNHDFSAVEVGNTGLLGCLHSTVSSGVGRQTIAIYNQGHLALESCTVVGESYALYSIDADTQLQSSVIVSLQALACFGTSVPASTFLSLGYNLTSSRCHLDQPTDRQDIADMRLGPPQVNAPGGTVTRALLPGSPAIDAGGCTARLDRRDQRGVAAPQGDSCDVGAYERRPPTAGDDTYVARLGAVLDVPAPGLLANDSSPEGSPLTLASVLPPAHGDVTFAADGSFHYTPQPGYTGPDSFTYRATDGALYAAPATVAVWVGTPPPATVTIALDSRPDSATDIAFAGTLGSFTLDDAVPQDADAYASSRSFSVPAGTYTVTEQLPAGFLDANISCSPAAGSVADIANNRLTLTVGIGANVTCTFVAQRASKIVAGAYDDHNRNHTRDRGDEWLPGRTVELHNPLSPEVASRTTDAEGRATFDGLLDGTYTVCEVPASGWQNITPGAVDATYKQPCYVVALQAGQAAWVRFGESQTAARAARLDAPAEDIVVCDLPPTDDRGAPVVGEREPWEEQELAQVAYVVALPLVSR